MKNTTSNRKVVSAAVTQAEAMRSVRQYFDESGKNKIVAQFFDKTIKLYLQLATEKRKRNLGQVTRSTKTIWVRRKRAQHLHFMSNSYGFNYFILQRAKTFNTVALSDEENDWKIPVDYILQHGSFLYFKQQGFEKQIFVKLNEIEQFKIPKDNNRRF